MIQLILHGIGDYITQSDWMAQNKTKSTWAAFCHALVYSLPFLLIASIEAWLIIFITHLLIDRFRLARFVVYAKNFLGPKKYWYKWEDCKANGYHKDIPVWLSTWLLIIADNVMHLSINYCAILYFP